MAAEFVYNEVQRVALGSPLLFNNSIPCKKNYVCHENGQGNFILRGIVNCANACFATYQVTYNGNVAIPDGEVTPIAVAIAVNGEPRLTSRAIFTPAAVGDYGNLTSTAIIKVPKGCCFSLAVEYVQATDDPTVAPTPLVTIQNSNLVIDRIA